MVGRCQSGRCPLSYCLRFSGSLSTCIAQYMKVGKLSFRAIARGKNQPEQNEHRAPIGVDSPRMLFSGSGNVTQPALSYSPAAESGRTIHGVQSLLISRLHASYWMPSALPNQTTAVRKHAGCQTRSRCHLHSIPAACQDATRGRPCGRPA